MNTFIYIRSSIEIAAPPERIWPLLGRARLPGGAAPPWIPVPRECRMSEDDRTRECVTSRGRIRQRVTRLLRERELAFEMCEEDVGLAWLLDALEERLTLEPKGTATRLTRISRVRPRCAAAGWILRLALPRIHRYVHVRFKRLAEGVTSAAGGRRAGA